MDIPIPLKAVLTLTGDDQLPSLSDDVYVSEPVLAQASRNGANALIAPTDRLILSDMDEIGIGDDIGIIANSIIGSVKNASGGKYPVGAVLLPNEPAEGVTVVAFEDEHIAYLERMTAFKAAGADFAVAAGHTTLSSMRAAVMAAKVAALPIIVIMDVDEEGKSPTGTDYLASLITLQALGASAFGINCSGGFEEICELMHEAFPHAEIPLCAAGELAGFSDDQIRSLSFAGVAGWLDTSGKINAKHAELIDKYGTCFDGSTEKDSRAASVYCEAFFLPDDIELSEPLDCSFDISDELIDLDDENINAVCVSLHSTDEAAVLAEGAYMSRLPVCVTADDATTLEAALRYFQGRLIIDTRCGIPMSELNALGDKYGAILY